MTLSTVTLSITINKKHIKLNGSVVMLSVVMLNVVMLNVIMLNVVMLNVIMLNVIMPNVVMLIVYVLLQAQAPSPNCNYKTEFNWKSIEISDKKVLDNWYLVFPYVWPLPLHLPELGSLFLPFSNRFDHPSSLLKNFWQKNQLNKKSFFFCRKMFPDVLKENYTPLQILDEQ
jgi:hypothetical protein